MKYKDKEIFSNLHETSKSRDTGAYLLEPRFRDDVYNLDKVKDLFCDMYRNTQKLCSCDAYYENVPHKNYLLIEFKNTAHARLKGFWGEIEQKAVDSHMILLETFWKNRKVQQVLKYAKLLVVYNDEKNCGEGLKAISNALNSIEPFQGDKKRGTKMPPLFDTEDEFESAKNDFIDKFKGDFFADVDFIDKAEFVEEYIEAGYFEKMSDNEIVEKC